MPIVDDKRNGHVIIGDVNDMEVENLVVNKEAYWKESSC